MKAQTQTTLKGEPMKHPLALAVYNEGAHYDARVQNYKSMTQRQYRAYLLRLVTAQAHHERRAFRTRYMSQDIDTAVAEIHDAMKLHMADAVGA